MWYFEKLNRSFGRTLLFFLLVLSVQLISVSSARAQFEEGDVQISAGGGGSSLGFGLSGTVGYYVLDGVEASFGLGYWSLDDTSLVQVTPGLRYVIDADSFRPYLGTFYRRWFFTNDIYEDTESVGARAGTFFYAGRRTMLGLGVVGEKILDCPFANDDDCTSIYPEFSLALSF
ncbi:MAG: hypothetical protein CMH52_08195 [Myxococcales bacterium]|nr:hypothetical protein [Myxococcales bacterium]